MFVILEKGFLHGVKAKFINTEYSSLKIQCNERMPKKDKHEKKVVIYTKGHYTKSKGDIKYVL